MTMMVFSRLINFAEEDLADLKNLEESQVYIGLVLRFNWPVYIGLVCIGVALRHPCFLNDGRSSEVI